MDANTLLRAAVTAFNQIPNTRLNQPEFSNTYAIASAIDKYLAVEEILNVTDLASAKKFIDECVKYHGTGFHVDTRFENYINERGEKMYSEENAEKYNKAMAAAEDQFDIADEDIYGYALDQF